jgi:hypothetical protein
VRLAVPAKKGQMRRFALRFFQEFATEGTANKPAVQRFSAPRTSGNGDSFRLRLPDWLLLFKDRRRHGHRSAGRKRNWWRRIGLRQERVATLGTAHLPLIIFVRHP